MNKNNLYKNKLTEIEDTYPYPNHSTSTKKKINNSSKNSSKTYLYLNTKENNFSSSILISCFKATLGKDS